MVRPKKHVLTWGSWDKANRTPRFPRRNAELIDEKLLVKLIRESGIRICGRCHQEAKDGAPFLDGIGVPVSMRHWGGIMHEVENPDAKNDWSDMGYCQWAWGNKKCQKCRKD